MSGNSELNRGAWLIAAGGVATFLYGLVFLFVNFTSFIEIGLNGNLMGTTKSSLQAQNPTFYNFVSHLQVNLAAFIMAYGLALVALAWFGIRRGERWALWTALASFFLALIVGLPIHYVYGLAALGHVGPFYLVIATVLIGAWLSWRGMAQTERPGGAR